MDSTRISMVAFGVGLLVAAALLLIERHGSSVSRGAEGFSAAGGPPGRRGVHDGLPRRAHPTKSVQVRDRRWTGSITWKSELGGWEVLDVPINSLMRHLATQAELDFLPNENLVGAKYMVTGHLNAGDPDHTD